MSAKSFSSRSVEVPVDPQLPDHRAHAVQAQRTQAASCETPKKTTLYSKGRAASEQ